MTKLMFTLTDTGERRFPKAREIYFLVDDPTTIYSWEDFDGPPSQPPDKYGILHLEAL